jgi:crotonobetainyl-CoA:carnitine CoA-transferase CaiB-like acyl-CoA transferase
VLEHASPTCPLPLRLAMSFAARMAAGLGAELVKSGSVADDPVCAIGPFVAGQGALSWFLDQGKTRLAHGAIEPAAFDIVLCDDQAFGALAEQSPACVYTVFSLFPAGTTQVGLVASEFTIMASSGLLDLVGDPAREPLRMGGHQLAYSCGMAAYAGAVAALGARGRGGVAAEVVRVSLADTAVWLNWKVVAMASWSRVGRTRQGADAEWQVVRCADGWVALVFLEADWPVLRDFVDDARLSDARFDDRAVRRKEARFLSEVVEAAFLRHTRRELKDLALARRLPLGPVWTPIELELDPQNVSRGFLSRQSPGTPQARLVPRLPVLWNGEAFGL